MKRRRRDSDPRPTLHHEDDIRIKGRVEEVDQRLGAQLGCTGARSVSGALCARKRKMEPKELGRSGRQGGVPALCICVTLDRQGWPDKASH